MNPVAARDGADESRCGLRGKVQLVAERRLGHRGDFRVVPVQIDAGEAAALRKARPHLDGRSRFDGVARRRDDVHAEGDRAIVQPDGLFAKPAILGVEGDRAHSAHMRSRAEVHAGPERTAGQLGDARIIEIHLDARGVVRRGHTEVDAADEHFAMRIQQADVAGSNFGEQHRRRLGTERFQMPARRFGQRRRLRRELVRFLIRIDGLAHFPLGAMVKREEHPAARRDLGRRRMLDDSLQNAHGLHAHLRLLHVECGDAELGALHRGDVAIALRNRFGERKGIGGIAGRARVQQSARPCEKRQRDLPFPPQRAGAKERRRLLPHRVESQPESGHVAESFRRLDDHPAPRIENDQMALLSVECREIGELLHPRRADAREGEHHTAHGPRRRRIRLGRRNPLVPFLVAERGRMKVEQDERLLRLRLVERLLQLHPMKRRRFRLCEKRNGEAKRGERRRKRANGQRISLGATGGRIVPLSS